MILISLGALNNLNILFTEEISLCLKRYGIYPSFRYDISEESALWLGSLADVHHSRF